MAAKKTELDPPADEVTEVEADENAKNSELDPTLGDYYSEYFEITVKEVYGNKTAHISPRGWVGDAALVIPAVDLPRLVDLLNKVIES